MLSIPNVILRSDKLAIVEFAGDNTNNGGEVNWDAQARGNKAKYDKYLILCERKRKDISTGFKRFLPNGFRIVVNALIFPAIAQVTLIRVETNQPSFID